MKDGAMNLDLTFDLASQNLKHAIYDSSPNSNFIKTMAQLKILVKTQCP